MACVLWFMSISRGPQINPPKTGHPAAFDHTMDFRQAKELKRNLAKPHNSVGRPRNAGPRNGVANRKERLISFFRCPVPDGCAEDHGCLLNAVTGYTDASNQQLVPMATGIIARG